MSRTFITAAALCLMFASVLGGCSSQKQDETAQSPEQAQTAEQPQGTAAPTDSAPAVSQAVSGGSRQGAPANAPAAGPSAGKAATPPAAAASAGRAAAPLAAATVAAPPLTPAPVYVDLPEGTTIPVRLSDPVGSETSKAGDKFTGTLDEDIEVDGRVVFKRGTPVVGEVKQSERAGRVQGRAEVSISLTGIDQSGQTMEISTAPLNFQADSTVKRDAAKIGIAAGIGTAIGAIAGGGKGAAIGAAVGGGAGTATVVATRGKAVELAPETKLNFQLSRGVQVRVQ